MLLFYRFSLFLYTLSVRIAALFLPKAKLFVDGRKGLLLQIKAAMGNESRPRIWMHCSSLGEFEQGRPVLEYLRQQYPDHAIILTFFSPSGYQVRKKYKGVDYVFYMPIDTPSNAKQFILNINPELALFVKYDLWYYHLQELQQKRIPAVLISAIFHPRQGYFKWYGGVQRRMLSMLSCIFVQDGYSQHLLQRIGIHNLVVAGDTRFDRVLDAAVHLKPLAQMERLVQQHQLLIAGSTWKEDEQLLREVYSSLPANWKLILVPHEVDEDRIAAVEVLFKGDVKRWSSWQETESFREKVLVVDTIGLLLKIYSYGQIAWIGGGLGRAGVHNVLEAAVYGIPCAYGPVHEKYAEAIELIEEGGAVSCADGAAFKAVLDKWINNPEAYRQCSEKAQHYVHSRGGATKVVTNYLAAKNWLSTL